MEKKRIKINQIYVIGKRRLLNADKTNKYQFNLTCTIFMWFETLKSLWKQSRWHNSSIGTRYLRLGFHQPQWFHLSEKIFNVYFIENVNVMHTMMLYNVYCAPHTQQRGTFTHADNKIEPIILTERRWQKHSMVLIIFVAFFSCFHSLLLPSLWYR